MPVEFLYDYLSFLAKAVTIVIAIGIVIALLGSLSARRSGGSSGHLQVSNVGDEVRSYARAIQEAQLSPGEMKKLYKADAKQIKAETKAADKGGERSGRVYALSFKGDMDAGSVSNLRREITAVLAAAEEGDEVAVEIESGGGYVHSYGLAASQLDRVRKAGIQLTAVVDKVAASGGYLMAAVADRVLAAPFAIVGSIGVAAEVPNVHRLLKKHDIDFDVITAGEYKRTLTVFGENTDEARAKFQQDMDETHELFQEFVGERRSQLVLSEVATGETWYGQRALERGLIDEVMTSDEYLGKRSLEADVYRVKWVVPRSPLEKAMNQAQQAAKLLLRRLGITR